MRNMRGSLWVFAAKTPSFATLNLLLIFVRPHSGPPSWNSNAYAIRDKCEKKIDEEENSFQIRYLQFRVDEFERARRGGLCHGRDSGAVAIASLVRRVGCCLGETTAGGCPGIVGYTLLRRSQVASRYA